MIDLFDIFDFFFDFIDRIIDSIDNFLNYIAGRWVGPFFGNTFPKYIILMLSILFLVLVITISSLISNRGKKEAEVLKDPVNVEQPASRNLNKKL